MNRDEEFLKSLKPTDSYAFIHKTSNDDITKILESGYLLSSSETGNSRWYEREEYRIFFSLVTPNDKIKPDGLIYKHTILIFDPQMYIDYGMRDLCHFAAGWNFGDVSEDTIFFNKLENCDYKNEEKLRINLNYLDMYLGAEKDYIDPNGTFLTLHNTNELVVYEKVPIDKYLKFIFIYPNTDLSFIPEKYRHLVINDIENKELKKYINNKAWKDKNIQKTIATLEKWRKMNQRVNISFN